MEDWLVKNLDFWEDKRTYYMRKMLELKDDDELEEVYNYAYQYCQLQVMEIKNTLAKRAFVPK